MMIKHLSSLLLAASLHPAIGLAGNPDNLGSFQEPSVHARPKFRYWVPDASIDHAIAAEDIRAAGEQGAGGVECLGYYLYGGPVPGTPGTNPPVSWSTYGFGNTAWNALFKDLLQAHKDNDLIMDFAMGPNQGTGVPAPSNSDGLMWDLAAYNVTVPIGGSFDGQLPGWGTGILQAAVTGLVTKSEEVTGVQPGLPGDVSATRTQYTLAASTLEDVTHQVGKDGQLKIDFPSNQTGLNYTVFAVYMMRSHYRAQDGPYDLMENQTPPTSIAGNGSWAVDHFSELGAQTSIEFWERHILQHGTQELIEQVGNYAWEDSYEVQNNVEWTKDMMELFEEDHGYSIAKYFPIIFHRDGISKMSTPAIWWITDEPDTGLDHIADFRDTLVKQYKKYLTTFNTWATERLGLKYSVQVGYNIPLDMLSAIPSVGVPECETLDFSDMIDNYRLYAGPANLGGRTVVSSECGAVKGESYAQALPELLWHVKRSYAGSINQFVFHGFPYSGNYGNTTWPVFTTFTYQYSNMHGPHDPSFAFYRDQIDYVARNNYVMQQGVAKLDIAIWKKAMIYPGHIQVRNYGPTDLEESGYTYEYIDPDNLDLPLATVRKGILAPDAQGFKAFLVRGNDSLTLDGVSRLVDFARNGLPIIFMGGLPSSYIGSNSQSAVESSQRSLKKITNLRNVHVMESYDGLARKLQSLGIQPATKWATDGSWYSTRRANSETGEDFYYVYNDAVTDPKGEGKQKYMVDFEATGVPYELDAWTGEETLILTYTQSKSSTSIPVTLAGNQTRLITFRNRSGGSKQAAHIADVSDEILEVTSGDNGKVELKVGPDNNGKPTYTRSDGAKKSVNAAPGSPITLTNWDVTIEHWAAPDNLYDIEGGSKIFNTHHVMQHPVSWQQIPELKNVSGRGYYSVSFDWPPSKPNSHVDGAFIDFGFIAHTLQATLNSHALPPLDVTQPMTDITSWLVHGKNKLQVAVSTTLSNAIQPVFGLIETSGTHANDPVAGTVPPPYMDYGLLKDVFVIPYVKMQVE